MKIFESTDYREFVSKTVQTLPKSGRGEYLKIAKHLGIHTSTLSQVLSGQKRLTLDQGCLLADYFGFNELETQYLLLLIELDRAGTERLRRTLTGQMNQIRAESKKLSAVIPGKRALNEHEKAVFYSNWYYTGIWALTSIPGFQRADTITKHFGLPRLIVNQVIDFLVSTGLCVESHGNLAPGTTYVHLEADSPFIGRHHSSWRQKAMERHPALSETEIAYSSPMSISKEDAIKIRQLIVSWIEHANQVRDPSPCEALYCLNIDWFTF